MFFFTIDFSKKFLSLNPIGIKFITGHILTKEYETDNASAEWFKYNVEFKIDQSVHHFKWSSSTTFRQKNIGEPVKFIYNRNNPKSPLVLSFEELISFLMLFGIPNIIVLGYYKIYCLKKKVDIFNKEQE